jgi:hypothetical protein
MLLINHPLDQGCQLTILPHSPFGIIQSRGIVDDPPLLFN